MREETPPYSVEDVVGFYDECGFDYGISVDHVIFQYRKEADVDGNADPSWLNRQAITLDLAERPAAKGDVRRTAPDTSRIERDIGWRAATPLADGLQAQWEWAANRVAAP